MPPVATTTFRRRRPSAPKTRATDFDFHVKQTPLIVGTETPLRDGDKLKTHIEVDFYGSTLGTQNVTNTYAPVLRQAFFQTQALAGRPGLVHVPGHGRAARGRGLHRPDGRHGVHPPGAGALHLRWLLDRGREPADHDDAIPRHRVAPISSDDNAFPDFIGRYVWKGDWGSVTLAGLVRQLKYETTGTNAIDDSIWTAAGSLSGKLMTFGKDDVRWMIVGGNLGRYVALELHQRRRARTRMATSKRSTGGRATSPTVTCGRKSFAAASSTRSGSYDNDVDLTGPNANQASESWTVNLFYSPIPKLDIGAEYRWAQREIESGDDGTLNRFQFTSKYSF